MTLVLTAAALVLIVPSAAALVLIARASVSDPRTRPDDVALVVIAAMTTLAAVLTVASFAVGVAS